MNNYYNGNGYTGPDMMKEAIMDGSATPEVTPGHSEMSADNCCSSCPPVSCEPIMECPEERVCHRYMTYEVPHIMPCNTRIINHHVYKHTYHPRYTCCEENVVCNVHDRKCC